RAAVARSAARPPKPRCRPPLFLKQKRQIVKEQEVTEKEEAYLLFRFRVAKINLSPLIYG
ncbi:hypothetical protein, partial [Pseudomonas aeruginosa]|uniref:hypothetical protein n=1 Tax=Pseudomonas aeruginosa TaxID=287 RepID=UPI001F3096CA